MHSMVGVNESVPTVVEFVAARTIEGKPAVSNDIRVRPTRMTRASRNRFFNGFSPDICSYHHILYNEVGQ